MTEHRPQKIQKLSHEPVSTSTGDCSTDKSAENEYLPAVQGQSPSENSQKSSATGQGEEVISNKNAEQASLSSSEHVDVVSTDVALSKSQLKKLRKREEWEAGRDYRKARRKEKTVERKARKREARAELPRANVTLNGLPVRDFPAPGRGRRPVVLPVTFMIDCGFDDYMTEKERISLGSQLTRSYSDNHRATFQTHLFISSWGGPMKERFDTLLEKHHENWRGVTFVKEDFVGAARIAMERMLSKRGGKLAGALSSSPDIHEIQTISQSSTSSTTKSITQTHSQAEQEPRDEAVLLAEDQDDKRLHQGAERVNGHHHNHNPTPSTASAPPANQQPPIPSESSTTETLPQPKIVYLTSDSPHTLTQLSSHTVYIIGGIVDKNRHKGLCYKRACDRGVATAKLPISEYMAMQSRFVLATNHVVEIMLKWLECGDWGEAFVKVIPKRKGGVLRGKKGEEAEKVTDGPGGDGVDGVENGDPEYVRDRDELQTEDEATNEALEKPEEEAWTRQHMTL